MQDRFKFKVKFKTDDKIEIFDVININFDSQQVFFRRQDGMVYNIGLGVKGTELIQCTGIKDENGKLIYEGDIVKVKFGNEYRNGKVEYSQTIWSISNAEFINRAYVGGALINLYRESEIIGNIYENQELLKDGE